MRESCQNQIEWKVLRPPLVSTFKLPDHESLLAVCCGDFVKLIFDGMRMWVEVTEQRSPFEWYGILDLAGVASRILFHPLDIIAIVRRPVM